MPEEVKRKRPKSIIKADKAKGAKSTARNKQGKRPTTPKVKADTKQSKPVKPTEEPKVKGDKGVKDTQPNTQLNNSLKIEEKTENGLPGINVDTKGRFVKPRETLTEKQERFLLEYLRVKSAKEAAILAGYSEKTAGVIGNQLLKKPIIRDRLDELQKTVEADLKVLLKEEALKSFQGLKDLRDSIEDSDPDPRRIKIKADIHRDILDRAGYKPGILGDTEDSAKVTIEFTKPAAVQQQERLRLVK